MKTIQFSDGQIICILKQQEAGMKAAILASFVAYVSQSPYL
ncbi:MAG: hypothetical protein ABI970_22390 [Chloroflexota bacterium]